MDFNSFVNSFYSPTGVLSVEKKEDGCGEVRFVTGNDKSRSENCYDNT